MLRSIGGMLLARQNEHFGQLSRTGSSNGVTWPAMDPDTLAKRKALQRRGLLANVDPSQLGVLTGRLAGSFRYRVGEDSVRLVNVDPAANYFAGRRPLYPRTIPAPWLASAESIAQRKLDQLSNPT
ncbi:MAG: hypothetical protein JSS49_27495 [Planctomycetes bacterium]|nr:hypothetical protein [Planctomycetota bacterium]